jgi:hypothetical protein
MSVVEPEPGGVHQNRPVISVTGLTKTLKRREGFPKLNLETLNGNLETELWIRKDFPYLFFLNPSRSSSDPKNSRSPHNNDYSKISQGTVTYLW